MQIWIIGIGFVLALALIFLLLYYLRKQKANKVKANEVPVDEEDEVLELTEHDIENIKRIDDLMQQNEAIKQTIDNILSQMDDHRAISLEEALNQIVKPVKPEKTEEEKKAPGKRKTEVRKSKTPVAVS